MPCWLFSTPVSWIALPARVASPASVKADVSSSTGSGAPGSGGGGAVPVGSNGCASATALKKMAGGRPLLHSQTVSRLTARTQWLFVAPPVRAVNPRNEGVGSENAGIVAKPW